jgi:hypothetical protein
MASPVAVRADMEIRGALNFGLEYTDFPPNPKINQFALINGVLYVYSTVQGVQTWFPLNNKKSIYVHTQGLASDTWTINHGFASNNVIFAAYDGNGDTLFANMTFPDTNGNSCLLHLSEPTTGRVVLFAESEMYTPSMSATHISTNQITMGGAVVTSSGSTLLVNGTPVASQTDVAALRAQVDALSALVYAGL